MLKTIESFVQGKSPNQELCEDALFVDENLVAVIDGATTHIKFLFNQQKSGKIATQILYRTLFEHPELCEYTAENCFLFLNRQITQFVEQYAKNIPETAYPRASIIIYNSFQNEIWSYGDCQYISNGILHNQSKQVDIINSNIRAETIERALLVENNIQKILQNDVGRKAIEEKLLEQHQYENIEHLLGYPVLNGINFNSKMIRIEKAEAGEEVVLASDGYPVLKGTLAESEQELRRMLKEDPLCFKEYKSTKGLREGNLSFDDRTYWRGFKI